MKSVLYGQIPRANPMQKRTKSLTCFTFIKYNDIKTWNVKHYERHYEMYLPLIKIYPIFQITVLVGSQGIACILKSWVRLRKIFMFK